MCKSLEGQGALGYPALMPNLSAKQVFTNPVHLLATGFGTGLSPKAPGSAGTVAAVPLYLLLVTQLGLNNYLIVTLLFFLAGIAICGYTARRIGAEDPKSVVWDEIVGYLVAMAWAPVTWYWMLGGFVLFRLFDIWKPWPIRWLDRHVKGGFGIMLDDLVAGFFACLLLNLPRYIFKL